jgi:hypothetical protein
MEGEWGGGLFWLENSIDICTLSVGTCINLQRSKMDSRSKKLSPWQDMSDIKKLPFNPLNIVFFIQEE